MLIITDENGRDLRRVNEDNPHAQQIINDLTRTHGSVLVFKVEDNDPRNLLAGLLPSKIHTRMM